MRASECDIYRLLVYDATGRSHSGGRLPLEPDSCLGPGSGGMLQIGEAQGGRGGVGMSVSLPCVEAEPPVIQTPVNASMFG